MVKIEMYGGSRSILKVRSILQSLYKDKYSLIVSESIPEAVQWGASCCTASFLLDVQYVAVADVLLYSPKMVFTNGNWICSSPAKSMKTYWKRRG